MVEISYDYEIPRQSGRSTRYSFDDMEVGGSFSIVDAESNVTAVRAAAIRYGKRNNMSFSIMRDQNGEYRCWRVA